MHAQADESAERTAFPPVFWVANFIEVLERFAYYGIFMSFGIYMQHLGYSMGQLGVIQAIFIAISYVIPIFSGTFADRYGFKTVLIVSYLAYLPSILLLMVTKTFSGIALTMLSIGLAAGIFKPLISGTVRAVTDGSNKTLGFGIFYAMVNVGGSFGPLVAGKLRAISWDLAFLVSGLTIVLMLLVTIFFYKEPERETEGATLSEKFHDLGTVLLDFRFSIFLLLLGAFFWIPFWAFFTLCAVFIEGSVDTASLYRSLSWWPWLANFLSHTGEDGVRRVLGETIAHTGYIIMFLQIGISRFIERWPAIPAFMSGLLVAAIGFVVLGSATGSAATLVFLGIFLFAIGEMIASPRIQEYITWMAPKEKAGLYMGANFLALGMGALAGLIYTPLYGYYRNAGTPGYVWYVLAVHLVLGIGVLTLYVRMTGEIEELDQ